jgi:hypothetical protein
MNQRKITLFQGNFMDLSIEIKPEFQSFVSTDRQGLTTCIGTPAQTKVRQI